MKFVVERIIDELLFKKWRFRCIQFGIVHYFSFALLA